VCSNKPVVFTRPLLTYLDVSQYLDLVLGPEDVARPKPAPDGILLAAAKLTQDPQVTTQVQIYKTHLRNLQPILERLRQMLLAQRSQLATNQAQLKAASNWAAALSTTQQL